MDTKKEEPKVELTKEELKILINVIAQASCRVVDAPVLIGISNKIAKIIDNFK